MSSCCLGLVWELYPGGAGDFKLALALGDHADEEGYVYIEASLQLLHRARLNEAGFSHAMAQLRKNRWLIRVDASECLYRLGPPGHLDEPTQRTFSRLSSAR